MQKRIERLKSQSYVAPRAENVRVFNEGLLCSSIEIDKSVRTESFYIEDLG